MVEFDKLNAQLLTVTDSNGLVIYSLIVPDGKLDHQSMLLKLIINIQKCAHRSDIVNIVSVDNASQFGGQLKDEYTKHTKNQLIVLQDIWHAKQRIKRELRIGHPSLAQANIELNEASSANRSR